MKAHEIIKTLCKNQGISLSGLEKILQYGNGSLSKAKVIPSDRILEIAKYFNVSMEYLMTGEEPDSESTGLTAKDNRDIKKDLDSIMNKIESGQDSPLYYNGEEVDQESMELLRDAIGMSLRHLKIINKEKYNPHKNKK